LAFPSLVCFLKIIYSRFDGLTGTG